ncbi:UDP-N-acetylglucosamine 1-carboxyvinyltransferase [Dysosmobacter sp.]|uniref:UDP-N-acetylglucosamine 1-carboxyvinyltransferase n=1 Tax=Dysosmobacter sp. TaxID=2591382 RepID=UPI002A958500|nr:UDP-N-acetylglucosamine 1-carboxyvinyltransferase [Dysosmobacter sp.]MDY5613517.1 UDP-N-acetylglucosamine 1-carboxyvinyltransferase [Dysosmobacter sp.]
MQKYVIHGGHPLFGEIEISGAKNAAVAIIPAALLVDGCCRIENIPQISDVTVVMEILQELGADVRTINKNTFEIDCRHIRSCRVPDELARRMRASYYLIGALLGRFGEAQVSMPGGCDLGVRPIDLHLKSFKALGADIDLQGGFVYAQAPQKRLTGATIYMDQVSVGATINAILASVLANGLTVIENAAKEPHIVDVANFLNSMGANIMGAGTDVIKIHGVESLHGGTYSIIPDQIEAGTYMAAVAATGGSVLIRNIIPKHMDCITAKLVEMGVEVEENEDTLLVRRTGKLQKTNIKTLPYPGFPTDMQPQITTVLSLAEGTSLVTEGVWGSRYRYVDELKRMGANIQVDDKTAVVEGVDHLTGAPIQAYDLRAGAALVIAALAAHGQSEITQVQYIERGYEDIISKLRALGADIRSVEEPEEAPAANVG